VKKAALLFFGTHYHLSSYLHVGTRQDMAVVVVVLVARRKKKIPEVGLAGWYYWHKNEVQTNVSDRILPDEISGDSQEL